MMQRKPRPTGTADADPVSVVPTTSAIQILGVNEVANLLGVPQSTIYEMCRFRSVNRGNQIPFRRIGRYTKFILSEVQDWLLRTPLATRTNKRAYRKT